MPKIRGDQYISLILICVGLLLSQSRGLPSAAQFASSLVTPQTIDVALVPIFAPPTINEPEATASSKAEIESTFLASISAQSIYVVDMPSASVLLQKNSEQLQAPASTTKLLTALVARDIYTLNQELMVTDEASVGGTMVGLTPGERLPVRDLLSAMLIQSGNDAAMVVANNHPQGYQGFIEAMNQKAREIGLSHSQFGNPSGIDQLQQFVTAKDLSILAKEVMKDRLLAEIVGTQSEVIQNNTQTIAHQLRNTNALLSDNLGVIGVKTGTTGLAGEVLITEVVQNGQDIVIVVMGSQDRYADTRNILQWVLSHYIWVDPKSDTLLRNQ